MNIRFKLLVLLLFVSLACPREIVASTKSEKTEKSAKKSKNARLLLWNIQNGMWAGQGDNYDQFVDWVASKDPDICVFCEAESRLVTNSDGYLSQKEKYLPSHWGELCARFGHKYWKMSARRDPFPQVITSKYPIDSIGGGIGIKPDSTVVHGYGWFSVNIPGAEQPIYIVTVHPKPGMLGHPDPGKGLPKEEAERVRHESYSNYEGEKHRLKEIQYIMNHTIKTHPDHENELWIMAGDFNSRSRKDNHVYKKNEANMMFLLHDYLASAESPYFDLASTLLPGVFCPSYGPKDRIDYIYVNKKVLDACVDIYTNADSYTRRVRVTENIGTSHKYYKPSDHTYSREARIWRIIALPTAVRRIMENRRVVITSAEGTSFLELR